ncbi:MAG: hypothetical protein AAF718_09645 [Pseudomonadota bacterium]
MKILIWIGAAVIAAPFLLFFGSYAYFAVVVNPYFANAYFQTRVPVETVLASRRWHRLGSEPWDCTYAIVDLTADAPEFPETWGDAARWSETPAPPLGITTRGALEFCGSKYWSAEVQTRLARALSNPGSYFTRNGSGQDLWIYAPNNRIAAKIRYGD